LPEEACARLIERLIAAGSLTVGDLANGAGAESLPALMRTLVWLHKVGLVRLAARGGGNRDTLSTR
jgi:hypothetical protein